MVTMLQRNIPSLLQRQEVVDSARDVVNRKFAVLQCQPSIDGPGEGLTGGTTYKFEQGLQQRLTCAVSFLLLFTRTHERPSLDNLVSPVRPFPL